MTKGETTLDVECSSPAELITIFDGVTSKTQRVTVAAMNEAVVRAPESKKRLVNQKTKTDYINAPWSKNDLLSIARILMDTQDPARSIIKSFDYLKSYGEFRRRSFESVQYTVNDLAMYLRGDRNLLGKRSEKYLVEAGFNHGSMKSMGKACYSSKSTLTKGNVRRQVVLEA